MGNPFGLPNREYLGRRHFVLLSRYNEAPLTKERTISFSHENCRGKCSEHFPLKTLYLLVTIDSGFYSA